MDPEPARTVFPIQNSPPTIQLSEFDLPPDTTFTVFSFAWRSDDPDGPENLARIEVSFNDSLNFVALPFDAEFVTFVGDLSNPGQTVTQARAYTGRAFQRTDIFVPGLQLDADNTLYVRAVDQTDTTSARVDFTWYVQATQRPHPVGERLSESVVADGARLPPRPFASISTLGRRNRYLGPFPAVRDGQHGQRAALQCPPPRSVSHPATNPCALRIHLLDLHGSHQQRTGQQSTVRCRRDGYFLRPGREADGPTHRSRSRRTRKPTSKTQPSQCFP